MKKGVTFTVCTLGIIFGLIAVQWKPEPEPKTYKFNDTQENLNAQLEEKQNNVQDEAEQIDAMNEYSTEGNSEYIEEVPINKLDIHVEENPKNELVFTISIDDFISSYNGFYWSDHELAYLSASSEWVCFTYDSTAHSKYETYYYRFSEDKTIWSLPTISVYVPTDSDYIQEITLDFDDHAYNEWMYNLYEEICFYAFKVLFPNFESNKITKLYNALYNKTNDPLCYVDRGEPMPKVLYYTNGIGLYSYYKSGMAHICIIPITNQYLDKLAAKKVEIHRIDNEF